MNVTKRPLEDTLAVRLPSEWKWESSLPQSRLSSAESRAINEVTPSCHSYRLLPCEAPGASTPLATKYTWEPSALEPATRFCTSLAPEAPSGVRSLSRHASRPASSTITHSYRSAALVSAER